MDLAFNELERFLSAEVTAKQKELAFEESGADTSKNLFSRVVLASQEEARGAAGAGLTHDEIRGNLFIYLFAGVSRIILVCDMQDSITSLQHETTAHTMVATLTLLATHQDEQQRIYKFIRSVAGDRHLVCSGSFPILFVISLHDTDLRGL